MIASNLGGTFGNYNNCCGSVVEINLEYNSSRPSIPKPGRIIIMKRQINRKFVLAMVGNFFTGCPKCFETKNCFG